MRKWYQLGLQIIINYYTVMLILVNILSSVIIRKTIAHYRTAKRAFVLCVSKYNDDHHGKDMTQLSCY